MVATALDPNALVAEADRLLGKADDAAYYDRPDDAERLARRAVKLYRQAARHSVEPRRSLRFVRAARIAEHCYGRKTVMSLVREACEGDPDYERVETLRGLWDCAAWNGEPFPEPVPHGSKTLMDRRGPIPGQMVLFEEGGAP